MIAEVMPLAIAIGRKAALMPCRCGSPNEIFEAPQLVLTSAVDEVTATAESFKFRDDTGLGA